MPKDSADGLTTEQLLNGILAMLIVEREERGLDPNDRRKTEVVLGAAGIPPTEIARFLNKNVDAVRKTLQRAR